MRAANSIVPWLVLGWALCGSAATAPGPANVKPTPEEVRKASESLVVTRLFAFGGVGEAGTVSPGEKAFRTVVASAKAVSLFRTTLARGTPEAKLYALCGLRRLDPRSFKAASKDLVTANPKVTTMTGCIVWHEQAATLVKKLAEGRYDDHLFGGQE